jgi:tRNA-Thr(GGU) m(6)t(6)A37 methyltransferase TsaA
MAVYNIVMRHSFDTIGIIHSPFREKFGVPRQPALAPAARARLQLLPPYDHPDCVRGLEAFSHVWISFVFHQTAERGWSPLVRPPRLGGNTRVGVFASRSSHRPNPLGLSLVELLGVDLRDGVSLILGGADLVDGTPVLDIKPYIPFVESHPDARSGFVDGPPPTLATRWSDGARRQYDALNGAPAELRVLTEQTLAQDPRPAYQDDPAREYGITLWNYNIRFRVANECAEILEINEISQN